MEWYPRYYELYAADTLGLTLAEHGAYCLLIDQYMRTRRPLPDDDRQFAAILRVGLPEWLAVASVVRAFFKPKNGMLAHKRCDVELDKQDGLSRMRSEVAKKGAEKRWSANKGLDASGMPEAMQMHATGQDKTRHNKTRKKDRDGDIAMSPTPKRATRIADNWRPNDADREFAESFGFSTPEIDTTADGFRDYWRAKAGRDAGKLDWSATWRNWVRRQNRVVGKADNGRGRSRSDALVAAFFAVGVEAEQRLRPTIMDGDGGPGGLNGGGIVIDGNVDAARSNGNGAGNCGTNGTDSAAEGQRPKNNGPSLSKAPR